jgi:hypothetical protein
MFKKMGLALAGLMVAGASFAQTTPGVVDPTPITAAITGNGVTVAAIGAGVLLLIVSIAAFKWSRRAL